jgi:MFS family permease
VTARGTRAFYGATFAAEFLLFGVVFTAAPFLLARDGLAPLAVGIVLFAAEGAAIGSAAVNGRLARRLSNRTLVACGFGCFAVGFAGIFAAGSLLPFAAAMLAVGAGTGIVLPSVDAAVTDAVSDSVRAGAVSLRNSTTFLGRAAGPVAFAGLATGVGYRPLLLGAAVVAGVVGLALVVTGGSVGATDPTEAVEAD